MKAWMVYDDVWAFPYHADTRGQVRMLHSEEHGSGGSWGFQEMFNVSIKRVSEFDDREFDQFELLKLGYYTWTECENCSGLVSCTDADYEKAVETKTKHTLCEECFVREGDEWEPINYWTRRSTLLPI